MNIEKSFKMWNNYGTRKDRRTRNSLDKSYRAISRWLHSSVVKPVRKEANRKLRRYKGDVTNGGWYKKVSDVWWTVF